METAIASPSVEETIETQIARHYRRNVWTLGIEAALFAIAMSFISSTTVLPAFVATLTDSEMIVGLASGLSTGAWLLPQLFIASVVAHKPLLKPLLVKTAVLSRPIFLLAGLAIWAWGITHPSLALAAVLVSITIFFTADAIASVPWFTLLGKLIPPTRRGRLIGYSQIVGGVGGIAAGVAVRYLLSEDCPIAFPANFALLYVAASAILMLSAMVLILIREPNAPASVENKPSALEVLRELPAVLSQDRPFQSLQIVRILSGFVALASAFYVLHATRVMGLPMGSTGLFVSASVAGSLAAGLATSVLQDRSGPLVHMRVVIGLSSLVPALALGITAGASLLGSTVLYAYIGLFFLLGLAHGSAGWPYYNWILEYADEPRRPVYIGVSNTLGALSMLAYPLGGWIVSALSYQAAFGIALLFGMVALALTSRVPSVRTGSPNRT